MSGPPPSGQHQTCLPARMGGAGGMGPSPGAAQQPGTQQGQQAGKLSTSLPADQPTMVNLSPPRTALLAHDFNKIIVAGTPPAAARAKRTAVKAPLDAHLAAAKLRLFCFDRTTGEPISGVSVHVTTVNSINDGASKNVARAFGNISYSRADGVCVLKLLPGHSYVITATSTGYHKFGELGEYLLVTPKEDERLQQAVGMVPIRISIAVTLRELQPLAGTGIQMDPFGQVNPLYQHPHTDKMSVQPQKVSFMTPAGVTQTFLASTLMAHDVLRVAGDMEQPAATVTQRDLAHQASRNSQASAHSSTQNSNGKGTVGEAAQATHTTTAIPVNGSTSRPALTGGLQTTVQKAEGPGSVQSGAGLSAAQQPVNACVWEYSTDSEGHCFFYGPRIDAGRRGDPFSGYQYLNVGPWQYFAKHHLERNVVSPPRVLFGDAPPSPTHQQGSPPRGSSSPEHRPTIDSTSRPGSAKPGRQRPASASRAMNSRSTTQALPHDPSTNSIFTLRPATARASQGHDTAAAARQAWLGTHPEIAQMLAPPPGASPGGSPAQLSPRSPARDPAGARAAADQRRRWTSEDPADGFNGALLPASSTNQYLVAQYSATSSELAQLQASTAAVNEAGELAGVAYNHEGETEVWDEETARKQALLASMGAMPMDAEGIHNYLLPGTYQISLTQAGRPLIFYTFTSDAEMAQIPHTQDEQAKIAMMNTDYNLHYWRLHALQMAQITHTQDEQVRITMPDADTSMIQGDSSQDEARRYTFPVQIYCRARPWLQVVVYDVDNGEEVGVGHNMPFVLQRLDPTRSLTARVDELRAVAQSGGVQPLEEGRVMDTLDAQALQYITQKEHKSRLAGLWAKAEIQEAERESSRFAVGQLTPTGTSASSLLEDWDALFVLEAEGCLQPEAPRVWTTPGDTYAVTLHMQHPFVEFTWRQTRSMNWELEPWVFYAVRKVCLLVGLREACSQEAVVGCTVKVNILDYERPPRPPIIRPEWCETSTHYARRLLDTLIHFVVQSRSLALTERVETELEAVTDADGIATFWVPPEAETHIRCEVGDKFEKPNSQKTLTLTRETEQFVGFQLERIVHITPKVIHCVTGQPVAGFTLKAYDVTHLVKDPPKPGQHAARHAARRQVKEETASVQELGNTCVTGLEPIWVGTTTETGMPESPCTCRAGLVVKVIVTSAPDEYLLPHYFQQDSGTALIYTKNEHSPEFKVPPKPRIKVRASDMSTLEWVHGARVRVYTRRVAPVFIPEGEGLATTQGTGTAITAPGGLEDSMVAAAAAASKDSEISGQMSPQNSNSRHGSLKHRSSRAGRNAGQSSGSILPGHKDDDQAGDAQQEDDAYASDRQQVYWDGAPVPAGTTGTAGITSPRGTSITSPRGAGFNLQAHVNQQVAQLAGSGPQTVRNKVQRKPVTTRQGHGGSGVGYSSGEEGGGGLVGEEDSEMLEREAEAREDEIRAAEEEPHPLPEWGDLWFDGYTGHDALLPEGRGLLVDVGLQVVVQLLPAWPFFAKPQTRVWHQDSWESPPVIDFMLPRDDAAFRFWMERDRVLHTFYDARGWPRVPYHHLARLQPFAPMDRLLAPYHPRMKLLRPPSHMPQPSLNGADEYFAWLLGMSKDGVMDSPWRQQQGNGGQGMGQGAGGWPWDSAGFSNGPQGQHQGQGHQWQGTGQQHSAGRAWGTGSQGNTLGGLDGDGHGWDSGQGADGAGLDSDPSAVQFDENSNMEDVADAAWAHLRMADTKYLPVERGRLMALLAKWGGFPHISGSCRCRTAAALRAAGQPDQTPFELGPVCIPNRKPKLPWTANNQVFNTAGLPTVAEHASTADVTYKSYEEDLEEEMSIAGNRSVTSSAAERIHKTGFRSQLLGDQTFQLSAAWAMHRPGMLSANRRPSLQHRHSDDAFRRTHDIMTKAEAEYCDPTFFTWPMPGGTSMHVAVNDLFYKDLVMLLDRTAASLEFMNQHVAKVQAYNASRGRHGRFLVGHEAANACEGGLFVLDVSRAQPYGGIDFMFTQLGALWDYWAEVTDAPPAPQLTEDDLDIQTNSIAGQQHERQQGVQENDLHQSQQQEALHQGVLDGSVPHQHQGADQAARPAPPVVGFMVACGGKWVVMKPGLHQLKPEHEEGGHAARLRRWWETVKADLPLNETSIKMPQVLQAALHAANATVPTYLLVGGLTARMRGTKKQVSHALYESQLECMDRGVPLQPIHTVELYPMPKLKKLSGKTRTKQGTSTAPSTKGGRASLQGTTQAAAATDQAGDDVGLESTAEGADIFELLQAALSTARVRLVDVYKELGPGQNTCGTGCRMCPGSTGLTAEQLMRLLRRFVPEATPAQLRYFQLLLDVDGDNQVSFKELSAMFKAANRSNMAVSLRDELELNMFLQRLGLMCVAQNATAKEVFDRYDMNNDGFLDQVEQWRMMKDIFPGMKNHEQQELYAAIQEVDTNGDERISWSEFNRAFSSGGVQQLQVWGQARDAEELKRLKEQQGGGPDELMFMGQRADQEERDLRRVRKAKFPITRMMDQLSGATRGRHRRLDLGHARAAAETINIAPLERTRAQLERAVANLCAFETAYSAALNLLRGSRSETRPISPAPGGGGGALVAVEPPSSTAVALKARAASSSGSGSVRTSATGQISSNRRGHNAATDTGTGSLLSGAAIGRARIAEERRREQLAAYGYTDDDLAALAAGTKKKTNVRKPRRPQSAAARGNVESASLASRPPPEDDPVPVVPARRHWADPSSLVPSQLLQQARTVTRPTSAPSLTAQWQRPMRAFAGPPNGATQSGHHGPLHTHRQRALLTVSSTQLEFTGDADGGVPGGGGRPSSANTSEGRVMRTQGPAGFRSVTASQAAAAEVDGGGSRNRGSKWH